MSESWGLVRLEKHIKKNVKKDMKLNIVGAKMLKKISQHMSRHTL